MKKQEPSINSVRGNTSSLEETAGSLSRPGRTALAQIEKPAWSRLFEFSTTAAVDDTDVEAAHPSLFGISTCILYRTAVCGPACTVVWGAPSAMTAPTRFAAALQSIFFEAYGQNSGLASPVCFTSYRARGRHGNPFLPVSSGRFVVPFLASEGIRS